MTPMLLLDSFPCCPVDATVPDVAEPRLWGVAPTVQSVEAAVLLAAETIVALRVEAAAPSAAVPHAEAAVSQLVAPIAAPSVRIFVDGAVEASVLALAHALSAQDHGRESADSSQEMVGPTDVEASSGERAVPDRQHP